jgi:hypothetical protein
MIFHPNLHRQIFPEKATTHTYIYVDCSIYPIHPILSHRQKKQFCSEEDASSIEKAIDETKV